MSTTTVTGTGRRLSIRQSNWQPPSKTMVSPSLSSSNSTPLDKFPPFEDGTPTTLLTPTNRRLSHSQRDGLNDMWQPRQPAHITWQRPNGLDASKHRPRKSISDAITTIRTRNASMSANAQELAEALKAPISYKLIGFCLVWYMTSALTNTSSKSILNALKKPITLTIVQFAFVPIWCLLLVYLSTLFPALRRAVPALKTGIRYPSRDVIATALPLAIFQLAGHILSSMATSQIPVSLVHTIKGLSPLFTVLAYRILFRIRYARATYLSLVPLTLGVMLACSTDFSTNLFGIICALCAALVFVSQNIFSKRLFNEAARAESDMQLAGRRKLDKLNLLCYCSALAFFLTLPIWFFSEGYSLIAEFVRTGTITLSENKGSLDHGALFFQYVFNGVSHFAQNILAFVLLSMVSPVSYSVASLIKRVFVIVVAIVWFGSATTTLQAFGILLTFFGLYLYDRNSHDDVADRRANADHFRSENPLLPLNGRVPSRPWDSNGYSFPPAKHEDHYADKSPAGEQKKEDNPTGLPLRINTASWLAPGTKQERTWHPQDSNNLQ